MATARVIYRASSDVMAKMVEEVVWMNDPESLELDVEWWGDDPKNAPQREYRLERRGAGSPSYQASMYVNGEFESGAGFYMCSCGEVSEHMDGQVPLCYHCCEDWTNEELF